MRYQTTKTIIVTAAIVLCFVLVGTLMRHRSGVQPVAPSKVGTEVNSVDLSSLAPGSSITFALEAKQLRISLPPGEGASEGTFKVETIEPEYTSGPVDRDGSLERLFIGKFAGNSSSAALFVIRNAGSGSYVQLYMLDNENGQLKLTVLPEPGTDQLNGYSGHDVVTVIGGRIARTFPIYSSESHARLDRNYTLDKAHNHESPIVTGPDPNVRPTAGSRRLFYNITNKMWAP